MTDLIAELAAQSKWLRKAAVEIAVEGHNGWGNTCLRAAETIDAHAAEIEAMARDAARYQTLKDADVWSDEVWHAMDERDSDGLDEALDAMHDSAREDGE